MWKTTAGANQAAFTDKNANAFRSGDALLQIWRQIQGHALKKTRALSALRAAVCAEETQRRSRLEQAQRSCFIPSSCYQTDRPIVLEFQKRHFLRWFFLPPLRSGPQRRGGRAAEPLSVVLKVTACVQPRMLLKAGACKPRRLPSKLMETHHKMWSNLAAWNLTLLYRHIH